KGLKVKFEGRIVLDNLSFSLGPNQHLAIAGVTGSGKSTLAKSLAGLVYHQGEIKIEGINEPSNNAIIYVEPHNHFKNLSNQTLFYYQQRYNSTESDDAQTVLTEINNFIQTINSINDSNTNSIEYWFKKFGLEDHKNKPLIQLSNGEHKKLQLIKALLHQPEILILDQPFTGLDVASRRILKEIINQLSANTTIIIISGKNDLPHCITHVLNLDNGCMNKIQLQNEPEKPEPEQSIIRSFSILPNDDSITDFSTAIEMRNVSVKYDDKIILQNINWKVQQGEKWLVSGPNGSGKSTLLSLVNGDNPQAYANDIYLFDKKRGSGESIWDIKKKTGFISPELHWYFDKGISVTDAIASGFFDTMGLYRKLTHDQMLSVTKWIEYFNLSSLQNKTLNVLSSGYQRLVLLARAMVKNPPLLILDEPCQGLDEEQAENFISLVNDLCIRPDKTLIYINHYENQIPLCINRKLELQKGLATISVLEIKKEIAA
ncbi:MAG TPA: ATP-binding cassette domain-containing protein, partial [Flavisolibacter sp.]|nr:ATP-binding cassette domain-containing protein [Flavisolibacter sp.]